MRSPRSRASSPTPVSPMHRWVMDIVEPPFLFEMQRQGLTVARRPAEHAGRPGDQIRRRDHAAEPGGGHGRRGVPGHRRCAQTRCAGERDRRAGQQAALRDGLGPGRGGQRNLRGAVQPAPAQLHRPHHPAGRPGVLRHHPLLQRLPHLLLPHVRGRQRHAEPARRLQAGPGVDGHLDRRDPPGRGHPTRSPDCCPRQRISASRTRWRRSGCSSPTALGSVCTSGRSSRG